MKVFGIGLHRTGTTTLGHCLEILGFKCFPDDFHGEGALGYECFLKWVNGDYEDILEIAAEYEGFQDSPWCHPYFYEVLDEAFPDSKFILTTRNVKKWLKSYQHWTQEGSVGQSEVTALIRKHVYDFESPIEHPEAYTSNFLAHQTQVLSYFEGKKNLMVVNWEYENWERLCEFLERPVPECPIPHSNSRKEYPLRPQTTHFVV